MTYEASSTLTLKQIALAQEAEAIHENYVRTGLHISNKKVMAWLKQLEAGTDADPPEAHL